MSENMRECYVAPYVLVDVIRALNNEDIWDIWVTKFDGHLLVRWHIKDENKQYLSKETDTASNAVNPKEKDL